MKVSHRFVWIMLVRKCVCVRRHIDMDGVLAIASVNLPEPGYYNELC